MTGLAFVIGQGFNGLSVASIFLLAALGLALSFGLMKVINMAHGELLMVGGYMAYLAYHLTPGPAFLVVGLPLAFVAGAGLGAILELTVIRRLYGRPLDTLLATWGVGLILQQAARSLFGATGVEVTAPSWMRGALVVESGAFQGLSLSYQRSFIIVVAALVLVCIFLLVYRTKAGLYIRAVNQNREVASGLGVNTRMVDLFVFALGAGLAGLAGATLSMLSPVTPTVGQSYIVNTFMVVILGGIGSLMGTALSAALVGFLQVVAQSFWTVSVALVFTLIFVVIFLQFRPRGLVSTGSRSLDEE